MSVKNSAGSHDSLCAPAVRFFRNVAFKQHEREGAAQKISEKLREFEASKRFSRARWNCGKPATWRAATLGVEVSSAGRKVPPGWQDRLLRHSARRSSTFCSFSESAFPP